MSGALIQLENIAFGYLDHPVFSAVNLQLLAGERLALVGGNGAGKSTLLQLIVGLQQASAGQVIAFGNASNTEADFRTVRAQVGILFQDSDDQLFCPTVLEDVAFGPLNLGYSEAQAQTIAEDSLASLGLSDFADRITHKLSGGEKRLVALATVLAMKPQVLLLDEPTNGLDEKAEQRLLEHLESLDQAMILVSHDRRLIARLATRAVMLQDGTLVDAVMHSHPHQHSHSHVHIHAAGVETSHSHQTELPSHRDHHQSD
ncbi:MAG: ABC transporter ATP-binding protein [Halopseudomonas sp.]